MNVFNIIGHTSLHLAAAHGRVLTLQTLLRAGAVSN